ncbi:MAG: hypothetical protein LBK50_01340 [Candidatus Nomurabacteria bacterium]|jgi:hypothetical protein|nr:hypothetical protein [Candidatus Nomurabacteria bacterium]
MNYFKIKTRPISGSNLKEVSKKMLREFHDIEQRTKRRPSVRCKAFENSKIFIGEYISHQNQKKRADRLRRLKFFPCAIDLIENTTEKPTEKVLKSGEVLYRLYGIAGNGQKFIVQISKNQNTGNKRLMSSFPKDR